MTPLRFWSVAGLLALLLSGAGIAAFALSNSPQHTVQPAVAAADESFAAAPPGAQATPVPRKAYAVQVADDGTPTPTPTPPPGVRYTVQPGDNLWAIARRFGTRATSIVALNGLKNANAITPGQSILVLPSEPAPPPPAPVSSAEMIIKGSPEKMVAFSFDAGSDSGYTSMILDTLARTGISASFGMTGQWAARYSDLLRRIVAEGHPLVNHSYTHPDFRTITSAQRRDELDRTEALLIQLTGGIGTKPYWRPPYGGYSAAVHADVAAAGYAYDIFWTVDSLGWNGLTASQIVQRCLQRVEPGAIYLFHVGEQSQDGPALQALIDGLRAQGYTIGSVQDVMGQ